MQMSDTVIKIEGLCKSYPMIVAGERKENYTLLREVVTEKVKSWVSLNHWRSSHSTSNHFYALKDIHLEIKSGQKVAIIGRNGAGKSTLLKILSRITLPTSGTIAIRGRVSSLLEVGTGFHLELTGRENIFLNGSILGMKKKQIRRQFDDIVDFSGVGQFIDTPVKRYSSGMKTRLGFSVAAFLQNDILILDEALAVGDLEFQKKCLSRMEEIAQTEGRTILFVSHNLAAVQDLCDTGVVLDHGCIQTVGQIEECLSTYNNLISGRGSDFFWSRNSEDKTLEINTPFLTIEEMALVNGKGVLFPGPHKNNNIPYFQIRIQRTRSDVELGILVCDECGRSVFESTHLDFGEAGDPLHDVKNDPQSVTLRVKLPDHFLNEGHYKIFPLVFFKNGGSILHPKRSRALPFLNLIIQGGLSSSPFFQSKREGLNAPLLRWEKV